MIQAISAIAVSLLTVVLGPLLRGEISGRLVKRIAVHADLRQKIEGNEKAIAELDSLLAIEIASLREKETYRLYRKINGANVAALVVVAVIGGLVEYFLVSVASHSLHAPVLFLILVVFAVLVGIIAIGIAAAGVSSLYEPAEKSESPNGGTSDN